MDVDESDVIVRKSCFLGRALQPLLRPSDFVEAYGDQPNRYENSGWNISFSLGLRGANALAYYVRRDTRIGASFWTADFSLYERLPERKAEVDELLGCDGGEVVWNDANEKSRELLVKLPADLAPNHWDELYPWIADRLLGIRKIAGGCGGAMGGKVA